MTTWLCGRTAALTDAGEDLALLGRGRRPLTGFVPPSQVEPAPAWVWLLLGGAAGIAVGIGASMVVRRTRADRAISHGS